MKKRAIRSRVAFVVFVLFALYALWLGWKIKTFSRQEANPFQPAGPPFEVVGVYHIHTSFSDGQKSPDRIARIAGRLGLDFIILTDHGRPNRPSLASQGWKNGTLVLAGSELSTNRGHLVALGFEPPDQPFSQNAEQAAGEIESRGGFSVIAHPFSKTRWSWGKATPYQGIEIMDSDTMVKRNFAAALPYLPALFIQPRLYLLKTLERPEEALRKWDRLNAERPTAGYFSADAHLLYAALFTCFRLHVLLDAPLTKSFEPARQQIFDALRKGKFFSAIDAAQPAGGFRFFARGAETRARLDGVLPFDSRSPLSLRVEAPFPFPFETRLLRDGETVALSGERELAYAPPGPGAYRVEVYLRGRTPLENTIPWILSNPILLREERR